MYLWFTEPMHTTSISFCVDTTDPSAALGFEFWVDSTCVADTDHVQQPFIVQHSLDDAPGTHQARFILKNKTAQHTVIDSAGEIVSDARLTISNLCIQDVALGHIMTKLANYSHNFNNTGPEIKEPFYGEMGCNGEVILTFDTPGYVWLLEQL